MPQYEVQSGDNLYAIAEKTLGDGNRWREIYQGNQDQVGSDPGMIRPGQVLSIPYDDPQGGSFQGPQIQPSGPSNNFPSSGISQPPMAPQNAIIPREQTQEYWDMKAAGDLEKDHLVGTRTRQAGPRLAGSGYGDPNVSPMAGSQQPQQPRFANSYAPQVSGPVITRPERNTNNGYGTNQQFNIADARRGVQIIDTLSPTARAEMPKGPARVEWPQPPGVMQQTRAQGVTPSAFQGRFTDQQGQFQAPSFNTGYMGKPNQNTYPPNPPQQQTYIPTGQGQRPSSTMPQMTSAPRAVVVIAENGEQYVYDTKTGEWRTASQQPPAAVSNGLRYR